jgi:hypothetical protein
MKVKSSAKGFKELPDVGTTGFVAADLAGWSVGVLTV